MLLLTLFVTATNEHGCPSVCLVSVCALPSKLSVKRGQPVISGAVLRQAAPPLCSCATTIKTWRSVPISGGDDDETGPPLVRRVVPASLPRLAIDLETLAEISD